MLVKRFCSLATVITSVVSLTTALHANEVEKGRIPAEHLAESCKVLPWGIKVWDLPDAVSHLKAVDNILWIDTRPESFFTTGTVRGALLVPYDKTGSQQNELTKDNPKKKRKAKQYISDDGISQL